MSLVVGVQFSDEGKTYYFDPGELELEPGDFVLVETSRGTVIGSVVLAPQEVEIANTLSSLKKVIRKADPAETPEKPERDPEKEAEAFRIAEEKIRKREMPMKLIDVECAVDGRRIIFYFAAEGRVDFRELVKDLAAVFRTRIELRQIGVRDEAKKVGGLGPCGRPCCCNSFLEDFVPVSIKMAKEQNLSLSPTKISGLCGRLMCCLHYEQETYHEMRRRLPNVGSTVRTPDGSGEVCDVEVLTGNTKVKIAGSDGTLEIRTYPLSSIRFRGGAPDGEDEYEPFEETEREVAEPELGWKLDIDEPRPKPEEPKPRRRPRRGTGGAPKKQEKQRTRAPRDKSGTKRDKPRSPRPPKPENGAKPQTQR